ncbi:hypothetical protein BP5796_02076 [Coleophoma crateriformis]|uniref:MJ1316 RNA cyclic group end recognition domain-containing protein n=1 Tax=Coleophoma crateriformis TaxID=565419 RepID=A0A3D8SXL7_9HELO|nr:hypothetical protein BP5796_02076 [Coleophoma crateriformis]
MTMVADITSLSSKEPSSCKELSDVMISKYNLIGTFDYDYYLRVRVELHNGTQPDQCEELEEIESRVRCLSQGLESRLAPSQIRLWPRRLVDCRDEQDVKNHKCYWLIGLPKFTSTDFASARQLLHEWQNETPGDTVGISSKTERSKKMVVQARFLPRELFLEHDFKEDIQRLEQEPVAETDRQDLRKRSAKIFKKAPSSNPQQVRQQFLQHVMGYEKDDADKHEPSGKLRPIKEVLNRLKYDSNYDPNDYVIGYIDRKAGMLEKPVPLWEEFEQIDLVAYFKFRPENRVVWDRVRKIDDIFNK